jgi:hypothetical protein
MENFSEMQAPFELFIWNLIWYVTKIELINLGYVLLCTISNFFLLIMFSYDY